ncbi:MFS transporter [Streptomyces sp. NPDC087440]|uniref:MFS transporter n=1 Tax=Streptomyces sp. NPDC087440 TaxID=3365790 RepID=UPI0038246DDF
MLSGLKASLPTGRGAPWFAAATFANAVGMGVYYPFSLLYFDAVLDSSLTAVGTALTVAALIALPLLPAIGRLIDRWGPQRVLCASTAVRAAAFAAYPLVDSLLAFVALSVPVALAMRTEQAATPVLAARLAERGDAAPGRWLALSRAMFNAGFGLGAVVAGLVVAADQDVLVKVGTANAVCVAVAAALYLALPGGRATSTTKPVPDAQLTPPADVRSTRPWQNRPFRIVVAAGAGLWIIAVGLETALPVHLVRAGATPAWTVSVLFALNTVLLALFQVPVAHRVEKVRPATLVAVGAALHVALPAALVVADALPQAVAVAVLVAAMVVYTLGELIASQAVLTLLTGIAPGERRGAFLAFHQMFVGLANALTPLLVTVSLDRSANGLWALFTVCSVGIAVLMAVSGRTLVPPRTRQPAETVRAA